MQFLVINGGCYLWIWKQMLTDKLNSGYELGLTGLGSDLGFQVYAFNHWINVSPCVIINVTVFWQGQYILKNKP